MDGREKVGPEVRVDRSPSESKRGSEGNDVRSGVCVVDTVVGVIAVVALLGVVRDGGKGLVLVEAARMVWMDVTDALRRSWSLSRMVSLDWLFDKLWLRRRDSEGRLGSGLGMFKEGSVRLRSSVP